MGWANVAALVVGIPILWFFFQEKPVPVGRKHLSFGAAFRLLATDRLVLRVIGSDFFVSLGQGFRGALITLFVLYYMKLPLQDALIIPLVQYAFGVLASPIWMRVARTLGKHRALVAGEVTQITINLCLLLLSPGQLWPLIGLTAAQGLSQGSGNLMLRSIVSDVADQERLKTGKDHSGLLFSIFNVTINAAMALSVGIALPLVGLFGFAPGASNSIAALSSLQWIIAIGPAIGHSLSALLIVGFPLDETRHAEIVQELAQQGILAVHEPAEPPVQAGLEAMG
jgi:Na+/melibiose symporter-like transporter